MKQKSTIALESAVRTTSSAIDLKYDEAVTLRMPLASGLAASCAWLRRARARKRTAPTTDTSASVGNIAAGPIRPPANRAKSPPTSPPAAELTASEPATRRTV